MIIDFAKFSSVKIGGKHDVSVLDRVCEFEGVIIGAGNNLLVSPNPPRLGILGQNFDFIELSGDILRVGAKTSAQKIFKFTKERNLGGFEFCAQIPGTLGGMLKMNAGLKGRAISDELVNLTTNLGEFTKAECEFGYRFSKISGAIFVAEFRLGREFDRELERELKSARKNQPGGASFGSCFKNPPGDFAGRLIEAAGLKGYKIGACGFSKQHANFLINYGGGTFSDAKGLIELAKNAVWAQFGVKLQEEVVIL